MVDLAVGVGAVIQTGATYQLEDGTKLGYYKKWRKDEKLWEETILPKLEARIKSEWSYSNDEEQEIPEEETNIRSLKDVIKKEKVSTDA